VPPPLPHLAGVEHQDLTVRGIRRHVAFAGPPDGRPVLLHHGWPQHWYAWRHLIPELARAGHRVIVPDSRGFGWSEFPPDEDFTHAAFVDDVVALCQVLGLARVSFVGHDWGCFFGFPLALRHPDLVERAVLVSAPHPWVPAPAADLETVVRFSRLAYQVAIASPAPPGPLKPALFRLIAQAAHGGHFSERELDAYLVPLSQPSQQRASTLLYRNTLLREVLPLARGAHAGERLAMPVLYMIGDGDPLFDLEAVNALSSHGDRVQTEVVPGAGHFLPEEKPDLVRDRVLAFLD
jgi:pimeloyl-ACP methyl ester carboxylesterase